MNLRHVCGLRLGVGGAVVLAVLAVVPVAAFAGPVRGRADAGARAVLRLVFHYRANGDRRRVAVLTVPAWYRRRGRPSLPLVIAPHGRDESPLATSALWGRLPAVGGFAVVAPAGQGRRLAGFSWGYPGQIDDLARMPLLVRRAFPWLRIDRHRIYAIGGSMGGQEALLLAARHPRLLAGVAAFDSVSDFARQYRAFARERCDMTCRRDWSGRVGLVLQALARVEVGGTPATARRAFALRSPITYASRLARSGVPIELWWSPRDLIIRNQKLQSGRLFARIRALDPRAPIEEFVGLWRHTAEFKASSRLPLALAQLGLLPPRFDHVPPGLHYRPAPVGAWARTAADTAWTSSRRGAANEIGVVRGRWAGQGSIRISSVKSGGLYHLSYRPPGAKPRSSRRRYLRGADRGGDATTHHRPPADELKRPPILQEASAERVSNRWPTVASLRYADS